MSSVIWMCKQHVAWLFASKHRQNVSVETILTLRDEAVLKQQWWLYCGVSIVDK